MDTHPDFDAAPEGVRWTGKLDALFLALSAEVYQLADRWTQRVLPRGAWVQMRLRSEDFRRELRIARRAAPATPEAEAKWDQECQVFLAHAALSKLVVAGWHQEDEQRVRGGVARTYLALFPLEVAPGQGRCECGTVVPLGPPGAIPTCEPCREKGRNQAFRESLSKAAPAPLRVVK